MEPIITVSSETLAPLINEAPAPSPNTIADVSQINELNDPDTVNDPVIWASPIKGNADTPVKSPPYPA